jgi:endo-1,4-beta-xylanase
VAHYKGQCYAWDVVNEAIDDSGNYRAAPFYNVMGTSYIPLAFQAAGAADPAAKLYYNDYNIESAGSKQQRVLEVIRTIKAAGARIDGVGLQGHFIVGGTPSRSALTSVLNAYVAAGVSEVAYTEVDIRFQSLPASAAGLQQQATDYVNVVGACLDVKACVGVTVWDFTDKYSWIPSTFSGQGDACLYASDLTPKPAYTSVSSLLKAAATGVVSSTSSAATTSSRVSSTSRPASTSSSVRTSSTLVTSTRTSSSAAPSGTAVAQRWGQCGGINWGGPTVCVSPYTCKYQNDWYSQCL